MMDITTIEEASNFFKKLSEADYIFFANQCSKFFNYSYNFENIEKPLRTDYFDVVTANERLQREKQNLEKEIKALEQNHKAEKERFEYKLEQEHLTELAKIREEVRSCETKYKNDIDNLENEKRRLEGQLLTANQLKSEFDNALKNFSDCSRDLMSYTTDFLKKPEKSQVIGVEGEQIIEKILNEYPFLKFEKHSKGHMGDFYVGFHGSNTIALVEVKHYKEGGTIPKDEVEKFINDLDGNSVVHCGIFIATKSAFGKNYQEYKAYKTRKDKPYFMISNLLDRAQHEIPLLFALSTVQIIVESKFINREEATELVDSCCKHWGELSKSAESMGKFAQTIQKEVTKLKKTIADGLEEIKKKLNKLRGNTTESVKNDFFGPRPTKCSRK